jgi:hypothetical protein
MRRSTSRNASWQRRPGRSRGSLAGTWRRRSARAQLHRRLDDAVLHRRDARTRNRSVSQHSWCPPSRRSTIPVRRRGRRPIEGSRRCRPRSGARTVGGHTRRPAAAQGPLLEAMKQGCAKELGTYCKAIDPGEGRFPSTRPLLRKSNLRAMQAATLGSTEGSRCRDGRRSMLMSSIAHARSFSICCGVGRLCSPNVRPPRNQ